MQEIEVAAGARFHEVGMAGVAEADPMPADVLLSYVDDGRAWVAEGGPAGAVAGYVVVDAVDGCAHVEQITVAPDHQGRGLARDMLDEVARWARSRGLPALTLTTFRDVPWNAPLYLHLGFAVLDPDALGPGLRAVREMEAAHGLDPALRVCMWKDLGPAR
jgi:GNAT superfamily N-acetyltransferase